MRGRCREFCCLLLEGKRCWHDQLSIAMARESLLEQDAILLLEFSWGVLSYREQPALIEYHDGNKVREYYPNFELVLEDGSPVHLEVKPT